MARFDRRLQRGLRLSGKTALLAASTGVAEPPRTLTDILMAA